MGVEPFLVSSSVNLAVAQRLVRRICPDCKESYRASKVMIASLGLKSGDNLRFYRGKGCATCKGTGYYGRTAICEMLEMRPPIRNLVLNGGDSDTIKQRAIEQAGLTTLRQNGIKKVVEGITTIEEVMRATMEDM